VNKLEQVLETIGYYDNYNPEKHLQRYSATQSKTREPQDKMLVCRNFRTDLEFVKILGLADIHLGSKVCDEDLFADFVTYVLGEKDLYVILMGDLHESATRSSIGLGVYDESYGLPTQRRILRTTLAPLVKEDRVLGAITGNHEMRPQYSNNDNPMALLCEELDIPYLGYQAFFKLAINDNIYHLMAYHGSGGGRTKGSKVNTVTNLRQIADVDVYLMGHVHDQISVVDKSYYIDDEANTIMAKKHLYVVCGSFLTYFGGYAEMGGLIPSATGVPLIYLGAQSHSIHCTM
jgi:UDP-2,3-diacylglucosamine pyrophosphatase LpxH